MYFLFYNYYLKKFRKVFGMVTREIIVAARNSKVPGTRRKRAEDKIGPPKFLGRPGMADQT